MTQIISDESSESAKMNDLTGMDIPAEELSNEPEPTKETPKEESKPAKAEEAKPTEEPKEEPEEVEDGEDEEVEKPTRPTRNERPIKSAFKQIKDVRGAVEGLTQAVSKILEKLDNPTPKQQEEKIDEISQLAEKRGLDPEGLAEIVALTKKEMLAELEQSGKLNKTLPADIQEKLKVLDKVQADMKANEEQVHFEKEWNTIQTDLQKQFPNAKQGELTEAKKVMDELAHSKEFHKYDLDYILFKNKDKFETILKVAKNSKSAETSSKQIIDYEETEDINLDPEDMTPDKMKAYQKKKYGA